MLRAQWIAAIFHNGQDALRLGAVGYLIKPFRYERFEEVLDKVLACLKAIESELEFT
jgi:response regulator of citrate/malate metabolism